MRPTERIGIYLVDTEAEVDGELHWLFRVLAGE